MRTAIALLGWLLAVDIARAQNAPVSTELEAQVVLEGLRGPWALAFAPDGRLFITERGGRIRVATGNTLAESAWASVSVMESNETGLMGLAIDPQFTQNRRVYICYTSLNGDGRVSNRIAALTEQEGKGSHLVPLIDDIQAGSFHNGCRLKFGPDGKLYATMGDAYREGTAQDVSSLNGKVLRMNADGSVPTDNPFPGSYVWSLGHRNQQGLAWQPGTGRLFATEHGTGPGGNNELNVIERGRNYGWPAVIGYANQAGFVSPVAVFGDAPAGATFVTSDRYPWLRGNLLVAALGTRRLLRFVFREGTEQVERTEVLVDGTYGRLRDVIEGPDGFLYVSTSNRDGRGQPQSNDDRILRLVPGRR